MLHNPQWDHPGVTKTADPTIFSLDALTAWLRQQDPNGKYDFVNCWTCLLARYFRDCGFIAIEVGAFEVRLDGTVYALPEQFNKISVGNSARDWTFGSALARAEQMQRGESHGRDHG